MQKSIGLLVDVEFTREEILTLHYALRLKVHGNHQLARRPNNKLAIILCKRRLYCRLPMPRPVRRLSRQGKSPRNKLIQT